MQTLTDIGTLIISTPAMRRSPPHCWNEDYRATNCCLVQNGDECSKYSCRITHLTLAQVHAALAYYYANQEQIESDIAAEAAEYERLAAQQRAEN